MGSDYPENWDQIRRAVYSRDSYTCQWCGATDVELHAHHKTPVSRGGSHRYGNLVTLCKSCHESHHGHPIGGREEDSGNQKLQGILGIILGISIILAIPAFAPIGLLLIIAGIALILLDD